MRQFIFAAASLLSIVPFSLTPASAADMPGAPYTKSPMVAPMFNWTGLYAGLHGGYGRAELDVAGLGNTSQDGGFAGGQIGYNWQGLNSPFVFGIEVDGAYARLRDSAAVTIGAVTATASSDVRALGSVRGRVGYAWDRIMLYGTGGFGVANNEISLSVAAPGFAAGVSMNNTHTGYVVGGGLEYAFAGPWSAKIEYLHYGLGSESYGGLNADLDIDTVKIGFNYAFR